MRTRYKASRLKTHLLTHKKEQGFSLLEILIAVVLLAVVGTVVTAAIINASNASDNASSAAMTQRELLDTTSAVTRDISTSTDITAAGDYYLSIATTANEKRQDVSFFYYDPEGTPAEPMERIWSDYRDDLPDFPAVMELRENDDETFVLRPVITGYLEQDGIPLFSYFDTNGERLHTGATTGEFTGALDNDQVDRIRLVSMRFAAIPSGREVPLELATSITPRSHNVSQVGRGEEVVLPAPAATTLTAELPERTNETLLEWTGVVGATGYTLYRDNRHQNVRPEVVGTFGADTLSTTDPDREWGESYSYYVVVSGPGGTSTSSNTATVTAVPPAPTISGTVDDRTNTVSWTEANGVGAFGTPANNSASGYRLYRINDAGDPEPVQNGVHQPIYNGRSLSFQDTNRSFGDYNTYFVVPYNQGGVGFPSDEVELLTRPPATTVSGSISERENTAQITWDSAKNADDYMLYRENRNGNWQTPNPTTALEREQRNLEWGETYRWTVTSRNSGGTSDVSNTETLTVTPPAPNLSGSASGTTISLSWPEVNGVGSRAESNYRSGSGYNVYRVVNGNATLVQSGTSRSFSETRPAGSTTNYYVEAYNRGGVGFQSNTVALTVIPVAPTVTVQDFEDGRDGSNAVSWNRPNGATHFDRRRDGGSSTRVTGTSWTDGNPGTDSRRTYQVRACNDAGCSGWGSDVGLQPPGSFTVTTPTQSRHNRTWVLGQSGGVPASGLNSNVRVEWSTSSGANRYIVSRTSGGQLYSGTARAVMDNGASGKPGRPEPNTLYTYTARAIGNTSGLEREATRAIQTAPAVPYEVRMRFYAETIYMTRSHYELHRGIPATGGSGRGYRAMARTGLLEGANQRSNSHTWSGWNENWREGTTIQNNRRWNMSTTGDFGGVIVYKARVNNVSGRTRPSANASSQYPSFNGTNGRDSMLIAGTMKTATATRWNSSYVPGYVPRGQSGLGRGNYPITSRNNPYYELRSQR